MGNDWAIDNHSAQKKVNNIKIYGIDGLIKFQEVSDFGVLLVEISGCFKKEGWKKSILFDDIKGLCALLTVIKREI